MFRTNYPAGSFRLGGTLLNREHDALNQLAGTRASDYASVGHEGITRSKNLPPPLILGVAKITDDDDTCEESSSPKEAVKAPCRSRHLYLARLRYFDWGAGLWYEYDEDLPLCANAFYESESEPEDRSDSDESSGSDDGVSTLASKSPITETTSFEESYGQIPQYRVGDIVTCYWDEVRQQLIPLQTPYQDPAQAEFVNKTTQQIGNAGSNTDFDSYAEVYLEIQRPGEQWRPMSSLSWRLPYLDRFSDWQDGRSNFAFFEAPHETLVRLRGAKLSTMTLETNWAQLNLWGAGRLGADASYKAAQLGSVLGGGNPLTGWSQRVITKHRFKDGPDFQLASGNSVAKIVYADPEDAWIIGARFGASVRNSGQGTPAKQCHDIVTNVHCDEHDRIVDYCKTNICFPGESKVTLSGEECFCGEGQCPACLNGEAPSQIQLVLGGTITNAFCFSANCSDYLGTYILTQNAIFRCEYYHQFIECGSAAEMRIRMFGDDDGFTIEVKIGRQTSDQGAAYFRLDMDDHPNCLTFENLNIPYLVGGTLYCNYTNATVALTSL